MSDVTDRSEPLGMTMQKIAEQHLEACFEVMHAIEESEGEFVHEPGVAPFCGCITCIVREVLAASWDLMCIAAELEVEGNREKELGAYCEDAITDTLQLMAGRLREEAEIARVSNRGRHPNVPTMTHSAALRYAADVIEGKYPEVPGAVV